MPSFLAAAPETPMSTWYKPKKIGIWAIIGRQEANGLVPCFLYSAICSCAIAWRESWSFFPLYLACSFARSPCMAFIPRIDLIWRINRGMVTARITRVRQIMHSTQVKPEDGSIPILVKIVWKNHSTADTANLKGQRIMSKMFTGVFLLMTRLSLCRNLDNR